MNQFILSFDLRWYGNRLSPEPACRCFPLSLRCCRNLHYLDFCTIATREVKGQLQSCGISTWYLGYKSTQVNFCPNSVSSSCQVYWAVLCMYDAFHLHNSNKEFWASVLLMLDSTRWREPFGGESLSIGSTLDLRIETWSEILLNMVIRLSKAKQSAFLLSQIVCRWLNNWPQSGHSHALTIPALTLKLWTGTTAITVAVGNTSFFSFARENQFHPVQTWQAKAMLAGMMISFFLWPLVRYSGALTQGLTSSWPLVASEPRWRDSLHWKLDASLTN